MGTDFGRAVSGRVSTKRSPDAFRKVGLMAGLGRSRGVPPPEGHQIGASERMTSAKASSTRESMEDREQRIALARWAQAGLKRPPELREARNLLKEFESRRLLTRAELRELVRHDYGYAVTTLYLNLTPESVQRQPRAYTTNFRSMRDAQIAASQELLDRLSREQFLQLRADLVEIEELLETMDAGHARSLVVFKAGPELSLVTYLPVRTVDSFSIAIDPYIAPAEAVLERYPRLLVAGVHQEQSRCAARVL